MNRRFTMNHNGKTMVMYDMRTNKKYIRKKVKVIFKYSSKWRETKEIYRFVEADSDGQ